MSAQTFAVDDRVMWSTGRGCPGTVEPRDGWRYPDDLERFPDDVVVKWDDGMHSLVSPGALMPAPTDPSDGAVPKPNPAPSDAPSLVELDRQEAAEERVLSTALAWHACFPDGDADDLREAFWAMKNAIADYAKAVTR